MRQHIKTTIYRGHIEPIIKFKTWYGGSVECVRCASFSPKRGTYNKRNNVAKTVA